jgi:4-hydroxybenzoate polyprenyltransferase
MPRMTYEQFQRLNLVVGICSLILISTAMIGGKIWPMLAATLLWVVAGTIKTVSRVQNPLAPPRKKFLFRANTVVMTAFFGLLAVYWLWIGLGGRL